MDTLRPILFVENNLDDIYLFRRVLAKTGVQNPVLTFEDGRAAVEYLERAFTYPPIVTLPFIIFTDLKMSGMGGIEFCRWLRGHPTLQSMTTLVLSGSELHGDLKKSREAGSNGYLIKFPTSADLTAILADAGGTFKPSTAHQPA